ncbi:MAG: SdpI family protein [Oscillospiraceae bacterium]|nr:SdpI family protein [Oscillospiraceae bacterium]
MIKKNWKVLVITSLMILLPIVAGVILWEQLPERIPTHWNAAGEIDGWSSKPFAVFGLPLFLLGIQWLCVLGTGADPKKKNHPEKILHLVLWIIPVLSGLLSAVTYAVALGKAVRMEVIMPVFIGLVLAIVGNYLPKCKQNYTIGIKIPWTLNSEENWNKTHRFAGRLWLVCGLVIALTGFFGGFMIFFGVVLLMVLAPCIYSYLLHRKGI